jgi:hypothetical protein
MMATGGPKHVNSNNIKKENLRLRKKLINLKYILLRIAIASRFPYYIFNIFIFPCSAPNVIRRSGINKLTVQTPTL